MQLKQPRKASQGSMTSIPVSVQISDTSLVQSWSSAALLYTILHLTEVQIIPLLHESAKAGNLPFGAAILSQADLHPVTVAANNVQGSPLLHGETNCIRQFFEIAEDIRPDTGSCIFYATHEPCSLCLSGIAWTAFPVVYYLFTYEDIREQLGIPGGVDILEEVFRVPAPSDTEESLRDRPLYNRENQFFTAIPVSELVEAIKGEAERDRAEVELERTKSLWDGLRLNLPQGQRNRR